MDRKIRWFSSRRQVEHLVAERTAELARENKSLRQEITYRQKVNEYLAASEKLYRSIFEQAAVGLAHLALDGRFIHVNKKFCDIVGYTREELLGLTFQKITHPDDLDADLAHLRELLAGKSETYSMEKRYYQKTGKIIWVSLTRSIVRNDAGEPLWFVAVVEDISKRVMIEDKLRISEDKFHKIFQSSPSAISISSLETGEFIDVNQGYERILGYSPGELIGKSSLEINLWKNLEDRNRLMPEYLKKRFLHVEELELYTNSGETIIAEVSFSMINVGGKDYSIAVISDITERKKAERQIKDYQQRLKALVSQLMLSEERERRRIAGGLHDDVSHSLVLARMQLDKILKASSPVETTMLVNDISKILLRSIQETRDLIFELGSPSINELGLVAGISEWLEEFVKHRHGIETEIIDHSGDLRLAHDMRIILYRNVRELLANVIKHAKATKVIVRLENAAGKLTIIIADNGIGFDPEKSLHAPRREGGVGLFSIQERMTDLSGSMQVISAHGQGCKVLLQVRI